MQLVTKKTTCDILAIHVEITAKCTVVLFIIKQKLMVNVFPLPLDFYLLTLYSYMEANFVALVNKNQLIQEKLHFENCQIDFY